MKISEVPLSGGCHVVILVAGASIAATLRNPEAHGLQLPSMNNLPEAKSNEPSSSAPST